MPKAAVAVRDAPTRFSRARTTYCFDLSFTIIDLYVITHPPEMPAVDDSKRKAARETIDILHEISTLLNTHLDRQSLSYCVSLIENGVNPEALAKVIKDLRAQNERYEGEQKGIGAQ
ncbi:hypothetical protein KC343_g11314 [Hortaea werneckii]|uniref:Mitotic-spindle organizing protein 1 n=2 Tax=Hortaea werneckii TaxID=91943 RepID=A0A3M7EBY2_HORWE|nr:hypothetical protein KC352_g42647 [Hortaea werneckii]KAI7530021.1 hypothetical protein KC317_g20182 [Hortaea werneckii]KAI7612131.1 hypothetical protein KC343_g11314 [Hortaea werneckii]KAI7617537.1 hypothetical protein KC319_g19295 [Hortaea werneckii]KAI7647304.1 hypothetical protein KC322_g19286 [Hortaea werneckii]